MTCPLGDQAGIAEGRNIIWEASPYPATKTGNKNHTREENMGKTSDFIIENGVLKKYIGPGGDVVIPEGVTKLGREVLSVYYLSHLLIEVNE